MYLRLLLSCLVLVQITPLIARETKEERQAHTNNLRRFLQLVDFTVDDDNLDQMTKKNRIQELDENYLLVSKKLSPKKAEVFGKLFKTYLGTLEKKADNAAKLEAFKKLRSESLNLFNVVTSPALVPDHAMGQLVYGQYCVSCHGEAGRGDGFFTKNPNIAMKPLPKSFEKQSIEGVRSPFSYFNTLLLGAPNSVMESFDKSLSRQEIWSVAFYISEVSDPKSTAKTDDFPNQFSRDDLSKKSNLELLDESPNQANKLEWIRFLRNVAPYSTKMQRK